MWNMLSGDRLHCIAQVLCVLAAVLLELLYLDYLHVQERAYVILVPLHLSDHGGIAEKIRHHTVR